MKVARLHGPGDLRLHDEPEPNAAAGEAVVRVRAVGVCGSDLHWFDAGGIGDTTLVRPLILGHECAGTLEDGARVALDPAIPCGRCEWCLQGDPNLCPDVRFAGHAPQDGMLRGQVAWPTALLHALPATISDAEAAMLEPLGVAMHAVDLAHLRTGTSVAVLGCGPIGLLVVQLARLSGASRIIATDLHAHRLEAARACGAHETVLAEAGLELPEVLAALGDAGAQVAFEVAGEQPAVDTAIGAARPGGMVVLVGIPGDDQTRFTASAARRKGLTIKLVRRMKHTYARAIQLAASGQIRLGSLITHRFPLERTAEAFATAQRREGLKVIIEV